MSSESSSIENAKELYVLLKKDFRISRNVRTQWYFNNLNKICEVDENPSNDGLKGIEVLSIVPSSGPYDPNKQYRLTTSTSVRFLFNQYRLVFCIDLSPSVACVDIQHGVVLSDEVLPTLTKCLTGLVQKFYLPGNSVLFQPQLCISILALVPFMNLKAEQVLVQGWYLTLDNLNSLLDLVKKRFIKVKESIVENTKIANSELAYLGDELDSERFKSNMSDSNRSLSNQGMANPVTSSVSQDCCLLNILRFGMLSVQLLPKNSNAAIIVITDGVLGLPDVSLIDPLLNKLRNSSISCSFLQVGSAYHPYSCYGLVPNIDLMQFVSRATFGSYVKVLPKTVTKSDCINDYHRMCLVWTFQKQRIRNEPDLPDFSCHSSEWSIKNDGFYLNKDISVMKKKQSESTLAIPLQTVLSCRLREGYVLKDIDLTDDGQIQVILVYPWRPNINIECLLRTKWPLSPQNLNCHYEISIEGNYDFLHDLSACDKKKPPSSPFRLVLLNKFWKLLQSLSQTNQLLLRLNSFASKPICYTVPDSNKSGVPLFFMLANGHLDFCSESNHAFLNFWKPMCMVDVNLWQKFMHTDRIAILLEYDQPLPKHLHSIDSNGRYHVIQCRQATLSLTRFLRDWSSFVLIESKSYIKLLFREPDKPPVSFCIVEIIGRAPCIVLHLAFLGGTSDLERNKVVKELESQILKLKFLKRAMSKEPSLPKSSQNRTTHRSGDCSMTKVKIHRSPLDREWSEINCCVLLHKPLEKILVRYERVPLEFSSPIYQMELEEIMRINHRDVWSGTMPNNKSGMLTTLSRYLFHRRWIWGLNNDLYIRTQDQAALRVLSTLVNLRLQEGFNFAYSNVGIINMVLELEMIPKYQNSFQTQEKMHCVLQYLIFPPHSTYSSEIESSSGDGRDSDGKETEAVKELQLITEVWIEPQTGFICNSTNERKYLETLSYHQVPEAIRKVDENCLSSLLALEHLRLMCNSKVPNTSVLPKEEFINDFKLLPTLQDTNSFIRYLPFNFDLLGLLPKCHQAELLFSTYIQDLKLSKFKNDQISCSNQLLFDLLLQSFAEIHDIEISLTTNECKKFMEHVLSRPRACYYPPPFSLHNYEAFNCEKFAQKSTQECSTDGGVQDQDSSFKGAIQWKCFVKFVSSTHVSLVFVISSYDDLQQIVLVDNSFKNAPPKSVRLKDSTIPKDVLSPTHSTKHFRTINQEASQRFINDDISSKESFPSTIDESNIQRPKVVRHNDKPQNEEEAVINATGSITLPIYIYDCPLSLLINQILYPCIGGRAHDLYFDYTNKTEDTIEINVKGPNVNFASSEMNSRKENESLDPNSNDCNSPISNQQLKQHCDLIYTVYQKSFVDGIYSGLCKDFSFDSADIVSVVDGICEESVFEIDITSFMLAICGHVRDFQIKKKIDDSEGGTFHLKKSKQRINDSPSLNSEADDPKFPISMLLKRYPSDKLKQLHSDIKDDFLDLLKVNFKEIPSNPDYFFFYPPEPLSFDQNVDEDAMDEKEESCETDTEHDNTVKSVEFDMDHQIENNRFYSTSPAESSFSCDSGSRSGSESRKRHASELTSTASSQISNTHALFISLTCTVKCDNNPINMTVRSVPTCLNEIANCLKDDIDKVDLNKLVITLDIICLNLSFDIEEGLIQRSNRMRHTTSFCSNSSHPADASDSRFSDFDESIQSDASQNFQSNALKNLSKPQLKAIKDLVFKTNWMLIDEVASSMLDMYPIDYNMLQVVTDHIKKTKAKKTCITEDVPLKFVFGSESSLDKFVPEFTCLSLPNYRLAKENDFYYLIKDLKPDLKKSSMMNSLDPSLNFSSKFAPLTLHSDDSTELKKLTSNDKMALDNSISKSPLINCSKNMEILSSIKEKKLLSKTNQENDSESESDNEMESRDFQKARKHRNNFDREKSSFGQKSTSLLNTSEEPLSHSSPKPPESNLDAALSNPNKKSPRFKKDNSLPLIPNVAHQVLDSQDMDPSCESLSPSIKKVPLVSRHRKSVNILKKLADNNANYNSNTEDGYDGDSSDSEIENNWISFMDSQRPSVLPKFWLILEVKENAVSTYFHTSQRLLDHEDNNFAEFLEIKSKVLKIIKNICKVVNQSFLLQNLHNSRMCENLLVPETKDDIWNQGTKSSMTNEEYSNAQNYDHDIETGGNYLADSLKFKPGAFACNVVWEKKFILHHRFNTGNVQSGVSRGIQAMRSVLNTFSVNNRKNMFVFRETCGSIFYLRLHETVCFPPSSNKNIVSSTDHPGKLGDETSPMITRCPSAQSLNNKKEILEFANVDSEQDFRPRTSSGTSERDGSHDTISLTSKTLIKNSCQAIRLCVHGICEPGTEIKDFLSKALQNKLDDAVLDVISMTLERNPQCKLNPDDVKFIQKPNEPPSEVLWFTLPSHALPYLQAVKFYLRQNLSQFLSNQKYTDPRPEAHFQGFRNGETDYSTPKDDVFLYNNRPISSGNKGIACLVLSVVDNHGDVIQLNDCLKPSSHGYTKIFLNNNFEAITETNCYKYCQNKKSPGPIALIQVQIWEKGNIDFSSLSTKLKNSIRHSLWDLFMEYIILTFPLCETPDALKPPQFCLSEPSTPLKKGRRGSPNSNSSEDFQGNPFLFNEKQIREGLSPNKDVNDSSKKNLTVDLESAFMKSKESCDQVKLEQGVAGQLSSVFFSSFIEFIKFGVGFGVPVAHMRNFELDTRNSVPMFLSNVQKFVSLTMSNLCIKAYKNTVSVQDNGKDLYEPIGTLWSSKMNENRDRFMLLPGEIADYVLIGRNLNQWYKSLGLSGKNKLDSSPSVASTHIMSKDLQKFLPLLETLDQRSVEGNMIRTIHGEGQESSSLTPGSVISTSPFSSSVDQHVIIPRQQLFLILIKDKKVSLFIYNWPDELVTTLISKLEKLCLWNFARSSLLKSVILQKMGLFHNQPITRKSAMESNPFLKSPLPIDSLLKCSTPPQKDFKRSSHQAFLTIFRNAKPCQPLHKTHASYHRDPLLQFGNQLIELKNADRREIDKKLCSLWKNRGPAYDQPITDEMLKAFKQKSRMFHYCMSPFLFLVSWKAECGATRDHSVPIVPKPQKRQRNESGISIRSNKKNVESKPDLVVSAPRQRNISDSKEEWHVALCSSLIHEYAQYLQTLGGFIMIKTRPTSPRKHGRHVQGFEVPVDVKPKSSSSVTLPTIHLVKHVLGGLIGVEISFIKPFLVCRLYGLNCILMQSKSSQNLNSQLNFSFLEECDKSKVLMHLHSFTFDFHLFTIYSYISGRQLLFRQGYHMISCLDDFAKYYQKSPTFARNRIYADSLIILDSSSPGDVLFQYLIDHHLMYNMKMLKMNNILPDSELKNNHEYALIELTTHRVSYNDSNDTCHMEEFDMGLILCHDQNYDKYNNSVSDDISFKFYIILTSRKGLYPKLSLEEDVGGTFQVVNSCNRRKSIMGQTCVDCLINDISSSSSLNQLPDETMIREDLDLTENVSADFKLQGSIGKEAVNYLGYFSSEETLMVNILQEQAKNAKFRLRNIISKTMVYCRRDILWNRLLISIDKQHNGIKKRDDSKELMQPLDFQDFTELMELVNTLPLNTIDQQLTPFFNMHMTWYHGLIRVLKNKYSETCQVFSSPDNNLQYVVMINPKCLEICVLLSINLKQNRVELLLVTKDLVDFDSEISNENASSHSQYFNESQVLIENFIGACCYHTWTKLL